MEDAFRIAQLDLVRWLEEDFGLPQLDGYQLVSQGVEAPLANVVDPNYTRLREQASAYLSSR